MCDMCLVFSLSGCVCTSFFVLVCNHFFFYILVMCVYVTFQCLYFVCDSIINIILVVRWYSSYSSYDVIAGQGACWNMLDYW